jgi:RNA polymerase sigma-70 factor, ECF subfamily
VLSATLRLTRDIDLAEDCTQDAYAQALATWPHRGIPTRPGAWLTTVARNRARDLLRRESVFRRAMPLIVSEDAVSAPEQLDRPVVDDDRLRLIFTCCHPALSWEAQIALTLRLVCGLSTAEVARAFLVQESTMAARITRAKKKIAVARVPFRVPALEDLPERVAAVLEVVHLIFTTGHTAPVGGQLLRIDLTDRAIDLARLLHQLSPADEAVAGLLALLLLIDARRDARLSDEGQLVLLAQQDRSRWDRQQIAEGVTLLDGALRQEPLSAYTVQAAIAALHAEARTWQDTDWDEIIGLYEVLRDRWPSPVVELNRAVAVGLRDGPAAGLRELQPLLAEPTLAAYGYLSAARADFLRRLERWSESAAGYEEALALTDNDIERVFLASRLDQVRSHLP